MSRIGNFPVELPANVEIQLSEGAISVKGPTLGRTIKEDEELYTYPTSHDAKILKGKYASTLSPDDQKALGEIVAIRSAKDMLYGF